MKRLTISGALTDAEFAEIVGLIREFDRRDPERQIRVTFEEPTKTVDEAVKSLSDALPFDPGRATVITTVRFPQ